MIYIVADPMYTCARKPPQFASIYREQFCLFARFPVDGMKTGGIG